MNGSDHPENTRNGLNVALTLAHRRRRCANVKASLSQYIVFAGLQ